MIYNFAYAFAGNRRHSLPAIETFQTITTDASATPSGGQIYTAGAQNSIMIFTGPPRRNEFEFNIWAKIGSGAVQKIRCAPSSAYILYVGTGVSVSLGTTTARSLTCLALDYPIADGTPPTPSGATGTANADLGCPHFDLPGFQTWTPSAGHITLAENNSYFRIDSTSARRNVFARYYDGATWSPAVWYLCPTSEHTIVFAPFATVALATTDGSSLAITAPTGATIGGTSVTARAPLPTITGTTHNVTTAAELTTAIATAVAGDKISLAAGTFAMGATIWSAASFTANELAGNEGPEGIVIQGAGRADSVITFSGAGGFNFTLNDQESRFYVADLTFDGSASTEVSIFNLSNGHYVFDNVKILGSRTNALNTDTLTITGSDLRSLFNNCEIEDGQGDLWNGLVNSVGSDWYAMAVNCISHGSNASGGTTNQVITMHSSAGGKFYFFGGRAYDRGSAASQVVACDNGGGVDLYWLDGLTGAVVGDLFQDCNLFGCDIPQMGAQLTNTVENNVYFTRLQYFGASTNFNDANVFHGAETTSSGPDNRNAEIAWDFGTFAGNFTVRNTTGSGQVVARNCTVEGASTGYTLGSSSTFTLSATNCINVAGTAVTITGSTDLLVGDYNTFQGTVSATHVATANEIRATAGVSATTFIPTASGNCDDNGSPSVWDWIGFGDVFGRLAVTTSGVSSRGARTRQRVSKVAGRMLPAVW